MNKEITLKLTNDELDLMSDAMYFCIAEQYMDESTSHLDSLMNKLAEIK
jgi:hypothetical protein